jgi:hypothetical protein
MPGQVWHDDLRTFYETINIGVVEYWSAEKKIINPLVIAHSEP